MGRLPGYGYLALASVIWGSIPVVVHRAGAPAVVLVALRMGFGAAALGAFLLTFGRKDRRLGPHARLVGFLGVVLALHWLVFFQSIRLLPGATAVLIGYVFPLLVAVAAPVVLQEPRERHVLPLAVAGFAGLAVILAPEAGSGRAAGAVLALIGAVGAAVLVLGARRAVGLVPGPVIAFWQEAVGFAILLPPALASAGAGSVPWRWGALLGVVHTAFAAILFFGALARIPAQEAGVLMYLEPVSAVIFAWVFLAHSPGVATLVGGAVVVGAGIALAVLGARRAPVPAGRASGPPG